MSEVDSFITKFSELTEEYTFYGGEVTLRYDPKDHVYLLVTPDGLEKQAGVTTICHIIDKSNVLIPWACKMMAQKLMTLIPINSSVNGPDADFISPIQVTDFVKLVHEAKSAHKDKLEDAGEVGHAAHAWIEAYIKKVLEYTDYRETFELPEIPKDDRATSCTKAGLSWMQRHNVRWISTERKIYSREDKYAGTMDGLCRADSCSDPACCKVQFKDKLTLVDWKTSNYLYIEYILQTAAYKKAYEEETGEHIEDIWIIRLGKEDAEFDAWHVDLETAELGWQAFKAALGLSRAMVLVEEAVGQMKDHRKQLEKAAKAAKKAEDLKVKCKNADRYKGIRKPTCNNGNPCETCLKRYAETQERIAKDLQNLVDKLK